MDATTLPLYAGTPDQKFTRAVRDIARRQSVLFHGTSLGSMIARTNTLLYPSVGDPAISFTRSPETAVHFATLPKDFDDGLPTVFVFNRQSLRSRYRVEPYQCPPPENHKEGKFEMEEMIWHRDVEQVSRHLAAIVYCLLDDVFVETDISEMGRSYKRIASACAEVSLEFRSGRIAS